MGENRPYNEKEEEKRHEKSSEEKNWDEKYRRDPVSGVVWALILIWAGVVLLADNLGFLENLRTQAQEAPGFLRFFGTAETWGLIFLGAGAIILIGVLVRLLVPEYRREIGGSLFLGFFLMAIGLGNLVNWDLIWPLILIAFGISLVLRAVFRRS